MADSDLGVRVHSQVDGTDGRVQIKDVGHGSSAALGAAAQNQVIVDAQGNKHIEVHGDDPAGTDRVIRLSENGAAKIEGAYDAATNTKPSSVGVIALARNVAPADSQQTLRITGIASGTGLRRALDTALLDESGEPFTMTNPLPVVLAESEGAEVHDYSMAANIASLAESNHNYSVAIGTTFVLSQVVTDASGDARYELLIGDGATPTEAFVTKAVRYTSNSKGGDLSLSKGIAVTAGATARTVRVKRKNLDNKVQDIHTTIVGVTL